MRRIRVLAVIGAAGIVALTAACSDSGTVTAAKTAASSAPSASATAGATPSAGLIPPATPTSGASGTDGSDSADTGDFSAGRSTPVADDVYPQYGDPATDALHYGLNLTWDPAAKVLTGTATLTVRAAKPTDHFVLDLAHGMAVDSMTVAGAHIASPAHTADRLTVPLGASKPADTVVTVVIAYHGTPQLVPPPMTRPDIAGIGAQPTDTGAIWAQQEPYGAFSWFPCNDQPSDKALYDVAITAPDGWAGVTGGTFQGRTEVNGSGVYKWHQPSPVATYLVAFAVDRFQEDTATGPHGLPMTFWYLPQDATDAKALSSQVPGIISFLEQHYGPYLFPTAGVLFLPDMVGMETQTMITLYAKIPADDLLHELAHHWFGDAVTPDTWEGLWLNEGFAMYSQFLWDAQQQGIPMDTYMADYRGRDQQLRTLDGPPGHYMPTHFASSNVYICPALMLNGLRDKLGDKVFYKVLTDWVQQHRYTNQDRASFTKFLNAETGQDFTAYVNAWLDSPTTPAS
jgi:aminopeptidase N